MIYWDMLGSQEKYTLNQIQILLSHTQTYIVHHVEKCFLQLPVQKD